MPCCASVSSDAVGFDVAVHHGIDGQRGDGADVELFRDVLAVGNDGGSADAEAVGNFLVGQALGDEHEHFYLAVGKSVGVGVLRLRGLHVGGEPFSVCVCALLQLEKCAHEVFFVLVDVQRVEVGELRGACCAVGQHDGLGFPFDEEGTVFQQDLGGDEIVDIHVRRVANELPETVERAHHGHGHHPFDEFPQSDAGQRVGIDNGDFWCRLHGVAYGFSRQSY